MKNKKKYVLMFLFFVIIIFLTFTSIFDHDSLPSIINNIKKINIIYIILCLIIICLYFLLQGIYMKSILKALKTKISLKTGVFYSLVEFYFSGITPSATGGQPVQLYYMTKDKIPIRKSYITLMLNTIYFKLIILILGLLVLIFKNSYLLNHSIVYIIFFILGFTVDVLLVLIGFFLLFKQNLIKRILKFILKICSKFKFLSKKTQDFNITTILKKYQDELKFINKNKRIVLLNFLLTFIQRLLLFSIAFVIYRSLGFNQYSYFDLLAIQVSVQVAIEALPLPGGAGLSEKMFHDIFITVFGIGLADVGMLLTRTFSFYIPLLVSGIIILVNLFISKQKKEI